MSCCVVLVVAVVVVVVGGGGGYVLLMLCCMWRCVGKKHVRNADMKHVHARENEFLILVMYYKSRQMKIHHILAFAWLR